MIEPYQNVCWEVNGIKYIQCVPEYPVDRTCSINLCWVTKWMKHVAIERTWCRLNHTGMCVWNNVRCEKRHHS